MQYRDACLFTLILFVAAGAFHRSKPADLMPELQGRFPIRVEMHDLTRDDFARILREPRASLLRQYEALLGTEGIKLEFTEAAIETMADIAFHVNRSPKTSAPAGCTRSWSECSRTSASTPRDRTEKHVVIDESHMRRAASTPFLAG